MSKVPPILPFFYVSDIRNALTRAADHHGQILKPIAPTGNLFIATLRDPAGNTLGLWQFTQP